MDLAKIPVMDGCFMSVYQVHLARTAVYASHLICPLPVRRSRSFEDVLCDAVELYCIIIIQSGVPVLSPPLLIMKGDGQHNKGLFGVVR